MSGPRQHRDDEGAPLDGSGALSRSCAVTVWAVPLDPAAPPEAAAVAELSDDERARAARLVHDAVRNRWLHGHVATRRILARALGVAPARIAFGAGEAGKPFVATPAGTGIEFSYSDSGELALVAVAHGVPVGVDVERMRDQPTLLQVAERMFAREEVAALTALPDASRLDAFYRIWTRKEAYLKAIGAGLTYGLGRFAVTHDAVDARLLHLDGEGSAAAGWSLRSLEVPGGHAAALAVPHTAPIVRLARTTGAD